MHVWTFITENIKFTYIGVGIIFLFYNNLKQKKTNLELRTLGIIL